MNVPGSPVSPAAPAAPADALVEEIRRQAAAQRQAILEAAEREAAEIQARARDKARRQLRRALEELRAAGRQRVRALRAELETEARRRASGHALDSLAAAWPMLEAALARRWQDPKARRRWLEAQLALARARLPAASWLLRHPAEWGEPDRDALDALLAARGVSSAGLRADPGLAIGLVVEADGARLDSAPQALLADRATIEAELLAAVRTAERPGRGDG